MTDNAAPEAQPSPPSGLVDRELAKLGEALRSGDGRKGLVRGCLGLIRRLLRWSTYLYIALLLVHCVLMSWVGERNIFFAFSLYLPPALWYLPAMVLLPLCLITGEWRGLGAGGLVVIGTLIFTFGWKPLGGGQRAEGGLVVLTNNRGQNDGRSLKPFKNAVRPDLMVFQEAAGTGARHLMDPDYGEFKFAKDLGEFAIVSRYPILSIEPVKVKVKTLTRSGQPAGETENEIAARSVVDVQGRQIVVYNVHLPSPRDTLRYYMRGVAIYGLIGIPGTPFAEKRRINQEGWDQRIAMVQALIERAKAETLPVILAGDFNMPSPGWCHSQMTKNFKDCHEAAGSGFGFTFPGSTHNPLSMGGVWMRIDYIFFGNGKVTCTWSEAEPERASQHRATAAQLRFP